MTVEEEVKMAGSGHVFTEERYQNYAKMHDRATEQLQGTIKGLLMTDIALALFANGAQISLPGLQFDLAQLPAAQSVLILVASFSFALKCNK